MSYWDRVLVRRVSRRRGLATLGAGTAAAAFLAACGGEDEGGISTPGGNGSSGDTSGLVSEITDTSDAAKRGGVIKWYSSSEPNHFDGGVQGQAQLNVFNGLAYGSLVQNKPGYKENASNTEVVPDLATSWEFAPDGLSVTFKLRDGVKWQNLPPVSGRPFDADDVVANWTRYEAKGGNKAANSNKANPSAPIVSVTATDKSTVVYRLAQPTSFILQRLATMTTGEAGTQLPREADNGFDPRTSQIGTGGFILDTYEPSVRLLYRRNPDYWNTKEPYADTLEMPLLPQYPTALAQFQTGNLYAYPVLSTDIVATKQQSPEITMYKNLASSANPSAMVGFGWLPLANGEKSPFLDIRVRRALSMSFDREAFIDVFSNVSRYEDDGLPVETFYYTSMGYLPDVTLDPREGNFGGNAKFFEYNPEEAKKLIDAAYPNGMPEFESKRIIGTQFGLDHQDQVEVLDNYAREVGFKPIPKQLDYNLEYLPQIVTQQGKFNGWAYRFGATSSADPVDYFVWRYWSKSGATSGSLGFGGPDGSLGDQSGDPEVDALIERAMQETDNAQRITLVHDLQKVLAGQMYGVTRPGVGSGFTLAWPALGNAQVFQNDSRGASAGAPGTAYTWWIDSSKRPLSS